MRRGAAAEACGDETCDPGLAWRDVGFMPARGEPSGGFLVDPRPIGQARGAPRGGAEGGRCTRPARDQRRERAGGGQDAPLTGNSEVKALCPSSMPQVLRSVLRRPRLHE